MTTQLPQIPQHVIDRLPALISELAQRAEDGLTSPDRDTRHAGLAMGSACGTLQILADALGIDLDAVRAAQG